VLPLLRQAASGPGEGAGQHAAPWDTDSPTGGLAEPTLHPDTAIARNPARPPRRLGGETVSILAIELWRSSLIAEDCVHAAWNLRAGASAQCTHCRRS
jgi:hypothetical protein